MSKPVVLLVPQSNLQVVLEELSPELFKHNILIKIMSDDDFNVMFHINTEDVQIDISDDTFLALAKMAHEDDCTINQTITKILRKQMEKEHANNPTT